MKQQAEQSKVVLHEYLEGLLESVRMKMNLIEQEFSKKIDVRFPS